MAERFTFLVITPEAHFTQDHYFNRRDADRHFEKLINQSPEADCVAYYCASACGQVNCYKNG
jgi:hypothetical protein